MISPAARSIINRCRKPNAYLRKAHVSYASGHGETMFFIEPGSERVSPKCAEEALATGWLTTRDPGLFGDIDAQTWCYAPRTDGLRQEVDGR